MWTKSLSMTSLVDVDMNQPSNDVAQISANTWAKSVLFLANVPMLYFVLRLKKDNPSSLTWTLKVFKHVAQHCRPMCFCFENQISSLNLYRRVLEW